MIFIELLSHTRNSLGLNKRHMSDRSSSKYAIGPNKKTALLRAVLSYMK